MSFGGIGELIAACASSSLISFGGIDGYRGANNSLEKILVDGDVDVVVNNPRQ